MATPGHLPRNAMTAVGRVGQSHRRKKIVPQLTRRVSQSRPAGQMHKIEEGWGDGSVKVGHTHATAAIVRVDRCHSTRCVRVNKSAHINSLTSGRPSLLTSSTSRLMLCTTSVRLSRPPQAHNLALSCRDSRDHRHWKIIPKLCRRVSPNSTKWPDT